MIISLDNLRGGLEWWHRESKWGEDLPNGEYEGVYADRALGITAGWWEKAVDRLGKWRAYRGPNPPNTRAEITSRGAAVLEKVAAEYAQLVAHSNGEPSIADHPWVDVAPLYSLTFGIKNSPVFAGKMCHFLFPNLFMVMDNWATDAFDYEIYWRGMRDAWRSFTEQDTAKQMLIASIGPAHPLHSQYPIETKIIELSHIGHKHSH